MSEGLDWNHIRRFTQLVTMANDKQLYEMAKYCIDALHERKDRRGLEMILE